MKRKTFISLAKQSQARALQSSIAAACLDFQMTENDAETVAGIAAALHGADNTQDRMTGEYIDPEETSDRARAFLSALIAPESVTESDPLPDLLPIVKRLVPWIGKLIAQGGHKESVLPKDAENALAQAEAAIDAHNAAKKQKRQEQKAPQPPELPQKVLRFLSLADTSNPAALLKLENRHAGAAVNPEASRNLAADVAELEKLLSDMKELARRETAFQSMTPGQRALANAFPGLAEAFEAKAKL